jgi:hypothetical protein
MHPTEPRTFVFSRYTLDYKTGVALFEYKIRFAERAEEVYQEQLVLPEEMRRALDKVPSTLIERFLQSLHLVFGLSYWKLYCPGKMEIEAGYALDGNQTDFWTTIYTKGLGEFYYRNQIDFHGLVNFAKQKETAEAPVSFPRTNRVLLPIGGGKDSMVSTDLLTAAGIGFRPFFKGTSKVQEDVLRFFKEPKLSLEGKLDPRMIERAKSGEAYNGHVPVSIIWSFVAAFAATVSNYSWVAFSNESSASEGNVEYLGIEINHQWSKSNEAEKLVRDYIHQYLTPDVTTFSLLRPLHELAIAKLFARSPQYLGHASSCNRNFVVSKAQPERAGRAYWCGSCPKCAFVFALLAPYIPKEQLVDAIGKDLFADESLIDLYRELLGVKGFKPFECVGTSDETRLAFHFAQKNGAYANEPIMQLFEQEVAPRVLDWDLLEKKIMTPNAEAIQALPEPFQSLYQTL